MVELQDIREAVNKALGGNMAADGGLFLVEVKIHGDEVEIFIDSDGTTADGKARRVTVDDCVALTKTIESQFDRDDPADDFSLTVSSAGIGQPLRVMRQYRKLVGRQVEVVLANGAKITGTLEAVEADADCKADDEAGDKAGDEAGDETGGGEMKSLTLSYPEKQRVEGKKRPEIVTVRRTFPLAEVKTTKEHIDFK